jgi:regulator of protease activity HflC (stomatin/prohibitin superfamily)
MELVLPIIVVALILLVGILLSTMILVVGQKSARVIERFGRFYTVKHAGLRVKAPFPIDKVAGHVSLKVRELSATVSVKTSDNVFLSIPVAVQFVVDERNVQRAFYELENPEAQIESYILATLRAEVNQMEFDDLYSDKERIAQAIETQLGARLDGFGFTIRAILVDEPQPTQEVVQAFNRVIAARREQDAARMEGEAVRIRVVAEAKANAESKRLQGEGIAQQRLEIARGFKESIDEIRGSSPDTSEHTIIAMLMMTNQLEAIRDASDNPGTTILIPYAADAATSDLQRMATAIKMFGSIDSDAGPKPDAAQSSARR